MTDPVARSTTAADRLGSASVGALLVLAAALLSGCTSRVSDQPAQPLADVCGGGSRISSAIGGFYGPAPWYQPSNINSKNCPYPENLTVYASCLTVTAVDNWDETGNGAVGSVYLQDTVTPEPIYSGISLYGSSFSPPALRVQPGDVLDVSGAYEEYQGPNTFIFQDCETLPQLAGAASFRFDGAVPAPVVIQPNDLSTYDSARKYFNMLVTVENVFISGPSATSSGRYTAPVAVTSGQPWSIEDELFDMPHLYPLQMNNQFKSVTGIVTYFGSVTLAPRSPADFVK